MIFLVRGKNGSGKSCFAENLTVSLSPNRYYVATMSPYGEEGLLRVKKHREQRSGMNFTTLERTRKVGNVRVPYDSAILLEDAANLLANAMFEKGGTVENVFADIKNLCNRAKHCVIVTIGKLDSPAYYNAETREYISSLNSLNEKMRGIADEVAEMQCGEPVLLRGTDLWDF